MNETYISHLASALGMHRRSVDDAARAGQLVSPVDALRDSGFETHHVCASDETAFDLALRAFEASGIDPQSVDAIVYSTCLPQNGSMSDWQRFDETGDVKHVMRFPASDLQAECGMQDAIVVGLNQQACTGMLGALRLARCMLVAESAFDNVLCITADRFPEGAVYEQAYNLISDGAAACLVSREEQGFRLLDVHQITNGAMVTASDDETVGSYFNYTGRLVDETLDRAGLALTDVRWVVPQNTNRKAWQILSKLLGISDEQAWFPSIDTAGHVISADNVINLAELKASGELERGDKVLTFMAGFGSNWQCALLEAA